MAQYIDKAALVVEIEKLIPLPSYERETLHSEFIRGKRIAYNNILDFLNTLEVKEVDLEKEINEYICNNFFGSQTLGFFANRTEEEPNDQDIALCAKHFFELGLKTKGE